MLITLSRRTASLMSTIEQLPDLEVRDLIKKVDIIGVMLITVSRRPASPVRTIEQLPDSEVRDLIKKVDNIRLDGE